MSAPPPPPPPPPGWSGKLPPPPPGMKMPPPPPMMGGGGAGLPPPPPPPPGMTRGGGNAFLSGGSQQLPPRPPPHMGGGGGGGPPQHQQQAHYYQGAPGGGGAGGPPPPSSHQQGGGSIGFGDDRGTQRHHQPQQQQHYGGAPPPPSHHHQQHAPHHYQQHHHQQHQSSNGGGYPPQQHHHHQGHHHYQQHNSHHHQQHHGGGGDGGGAGGYPPRQQQYQPHGGGLRAPTNTVWLGGPGANNLMDGHLYRVFGDIGRVMRISRLKDKNVIFVHYRNVNEAEEAVKKIQQDPGVIDNQDVRLNYGKMFEYTAEEMSIPYNPAMDNSKDARLGTRRDRDDFGNNNNFGGGARGGRFEPTNVLYIGEVPNTVTTDEIKSHLESFPVREVSRNEFKGVVFVHFDTTDQCTHCLDVMRDVPLAGVRVKMNYGTARPVMPPREDGGGAGHNNNGGGGFNRPPPNDDHNSAPDLDREQPTNVVFLGALPPSTTQDEVETLFRRFTGYMNCKFIIDKALCFGHFDTLENAIACRLALHGCLVQGTPIRVNFGKTNHHQPVARNGEDGGFSDLLGDRGGQVALHGSSNPNDSALNLLPTQSAAEMAASVQAYLRQARPAPTAANANGIPSMQDRVRTLMAMTYNSCGEVDKSLSPASVQSLCTVVDSVVNEETSRDIDAAIDAFLPSQGTHVAATVARRLKAHFDDDIHKKLLVLYAVVRAFLKADTSVVYYSKASLDMLLVVVAVAAEGQTDMVAFEGIEEVIRGIRARYLTPGAPGCKYDETYLNNTNQLIKEVEEKMSVDKDLAALMQRKR